MNVKVHIRSSQLRDIPRRAGGFSTSGDFKLVSSASPQDKLRRHVHSVHAGRFDRQCPACVHLVAQVLLKGAR